MYRTLVLAMLLGSGAVSAAQVDPFALIGGQASFVKGTDRYYPVRIERGAPQAAVTEGGMWLPQPDGGRVYARTVQLLKQAGDIQTWIGKVSVPGGERSVVITMGPDATFGSLVTAKGEPFRLVTSGGKTYMVQRDATAARLRSGGPVQEPPGPDYLIAPRPPQTGNATPGAQAAQANATAATSSTVDVLLAYTPGMVTRYGSTSAVQTRLNYLVTVANQAYADSKVNYRIRLVGTMAVSYSDTGPNSQVLDDMTNTSASGPLAALRAKRAALGADLVSLLRPYTQTGQGGFCGLGYLNGANEAPFTTGFAPYGFSTVGDGEDPSTNTYCVDTTLAHELGHNMGLAHNQQDAPDPGAFSYAYGWRRSLTSGSFATIMAYATGGQQRLPYFANPDITLCNGNRCGDPTTANQTLVLNQTMPVVANFASADKPAVDLNGDRQADIVLQSSAGGSFTTMLETADFLPQTNTRTGLTGHRIAAMGDLDGNGGTDLVWTSTSRDLYFWINNGDDTYQSVQGPNYGAGWTLVGTGDLNADGNADLLWLNKTTHQFMYWLMQGATVASTRTMTVTAGYHIGAIGDFNGDGRADIAWTSSARDLYIWTTTSTGGFSSARSLSYPSGWRLVGSGRIDGDQRADLIWLDDVGHHFGYWLMNGATRTGYRSIAITPGYTIAAIDQFSGGGDGILWTSASRDMYVWMNNGSGGFISKNIAAYPGSGSGYLSTYPSGWSIVANLPVKP